MTRIFYQVNLAFSIHICQHLVQHPVQISNVCHEPCLTYNETFGVTYIKYCFAIVKHKFMSTSGSNLYTLIQLYKRKKGLQI